MLHVCVREAAVSQQTVTPVYARDGSATDPEQRDANLPPRPPGWVGH